MFTYLIGAALIYYLYSSMNKSSSSSLGTEEELTSKLTSKGINYRVERRDGQSYPLTMDYVPDRANLTIENGMVTKIRYG